MAEGDPKIGQLDSWRGDRIILSTPDVDLPVLYHADMSYYSQIARLVLEEEGIHYISRGFDIHGDREQMTQWYLNVNPSAVVPTLIYRGKIVVESRDISIFAVDEISSNGKLLPKGPERQAVVDLVDLHFKDCNIEQVSMSTLMLTNKLLAFGMPKKLKSGMAKFEKLKKENPELENVIDKRIQHLHKRMKMFQNPLESQNEALEPLEQGSNHLLN